MALTSRIQDLLFGRPLATSEERAEHIGPIAGIPIFGLDALSSAAYGPEAALTLLIPQFLLVRLGSARTRRAGEVLRGSISPPVHATNRWVLDRGRG
jgi:hypothetical protein